MEILEVIYGFGALVGFAALTSIIVNILKYFGFVPDGKAGSLVTFLNIVGMSVLIAYRIFDPSVSVSQIDSVAGTIAEVLTILFGFVIQVMSSLKTYELFRYLEVPVLGYSNRGFWYLDVSDEEEDNEDEEEEN